MLITEAALICGMRTWWLAPTYPMAMQVWRDLKTILRNESGMTTVESEHRIDLKGGGMIAIRSAHHPDNLRGEGLDLAVLDEAAFMGPTVWPQVVRPMLLDRQGGALFLSTPYGRNWFWELYKLGLDPEEPEWASFHFPSQDNPLIAPEEFEALRRSTPERIWQQEYLAQFTDDSGQVFRAVRAAAVAPEGAEPQPEHRYVAGIDWGREEDFTAVAVINATTRQMVALDRFRQTSWALQRGRIEALYARWRPQVMLAEANSIGSVNIEALQAAGLPVRPFSTTAHSKGPLIDALALAVENGELALLPDDVLLGELASYTMERLPGGGWRYSAPPGGHDDTVIALALAWRAAQHGGMTISFA